MLRASAAPGPPGYETDAPRTDRTMERPNPEQRLARLAEIAAQLHADGLLAAVAALQERTQVGLFYVAVIGAFKRGKSTLLNALVDRALLPTGIAPVTVAPTVLRYGEEPAVRLWLDGTGVVQGTVSELETYLSERHNPGNARGLEAVEVFVPAPLLASGLCLVDTPGLGSPNPGADAATRGFVPQIDAVIAVIGTDPPLSRDELTLIRAVAAQVRDLIVVLNKADRFTAGERGEAVEYSAKVLAEALHRPPPPILTISAADRLAGRESSWDWDRLVAMLQELATRSGRALARAALGRGIERLARRCLREIDEAQAALTRPLDESERRLLELRGHIGDVAHRSLLHGFRLGHEREAAVRDAAERRQEFLERTLPAATDELRGVVDQSGVSIGPRLRPFALRKAGEIAERHLGSWLGPEQATADEEYLRVTQRFLAETRAWLAASESLKALGVHALADELEPIENIRIPRTAAHGSSAVREAAPGRLWILDLFRSRPALRESVLEQARGRLTELLEAGAGIVEDDLARRIRSSEERLQQDVFALLHTVYESADRAVDRARAALAAGDAGLHRDLEGLAKLRSEVCALGGLDLGAAG